MNPSGIKMLSGEQIVTRGRNVTETSLPELGLKDITPNGTWLEKQQIQTALETRKALVAVERIDKIGCISHAIWLDDRRLAEVTQQVGGHWQYLGYKVKDKLYLLPEEALYLMETNCLLLKHNTVTVSLQKAYCLLLNEEMPLNQYKVYASLSRLGYKVFRHKVKPPSKNKNDKIIEMEVDSVTNLQETTLKATDEIQASSDTSKSSESSDSNAVVSSSNNLKDTDMEDTGKEINSARPAKQNFNTSETESKDAEPEHSLTAQNDILPVIATCSTSNRFSVDENGIVRFETEGKSSNIEMEIDPACNNPTNSDADPKTKSSINSTSIDIYSIKRHQIKNRKVKPSDPKSIHEKFQNFPDFYKQQIVRVNVPSEELLPRNVYLNNSYYIVNTNNFSDKPKTRCDTPNSRPSGNRAMYRTIQNSIESENAAVPLPEPPQFVPNTLPYQQPFGFPIPRHTHQAFQRPFIPQPRFNQHPFFYRVMNSMPRNFVFQPRPAFFMDFDQNRQKQKAKEDHLRAIKGFAQSLHNVSQMNYFELKKTVHELLDKFNKLYQETYVLNSDFNLINTKTRIETIEIQDDEAVEKMEALNKYDNYLSNIKSLAARLTNLSRNNQTTSKQRRAFCNLLKHFNKEYDAALHLNGDGELIDKKLVVVDSSDSDIVATDETETKNKKKRKSVDDGIAKHKKRKILANPFSVIAKVNGGTDQNTEITQRTTLDLEKFFDKSWLPSDDDFGKALPCLMTHSHCLMNDSLMLYDFMDEPDSFRSWIELKLAFYLHMEAVYSFEQDLTESRHMTESRNMTENPGLKPIVQSGIIDDWPTSLEKLRIIQTNMDVEETALKVHFDVYNRDVQGFRKTDPPKPHFRIICIDETSEVPSNIQVKSLHSLFEDNVSIVFAVVGLSSLSYLQVNPTDLPIVYIGND